jgi:hypothetical protein
MKSDFKPNKEITDKLIMRILAMLKKADRDRGEGSYKLSVKIKKIIEEEVE